MYLHSKSHIFLPISFIHSPKWEVTEFENRLHEFWGDFSPMFRAVTLNEPLNTGRVKSLDTPCDILNGSRNRNEIQDDFIKNTSKLFSNNN